jgi:hypothetical protein
VSCVAPSASITSTPAAPVLKWPGLPRSLPLELREFCASARVESRQSESMVWLASWSAGAQALAFCARGVPGMVWSL